MNICRGCTGAISLPKARPRKERRNRAGAAGQAAPMPTCYSVAGTERRPLPGSYVWIRAQDVHPDQPPGHRVPGGASAACVPTGPGGELAAAPTAGRIGSSCSTWCSNPDALAGPARSGKGSSMSRSDSRASRPGTCPVQPARCRPNAPWHHRSLVAAEPSHGRANAADAPSVSPASGPRRAPFTPAGDRCQIRSMAESVSTAPGAPLANRRPSWSIRTCPTPLAASRSCVAWTTVPPSAATSSRTSAIRR